MKKEKRVDEMKAKWSVSLLNRILKQLLWIILLLSFIAMYPADNAYQTRNLFNRDE